MVVESFDVASISLAPVDDEYRMYFDFSRYSNVSAYTVSVNLRVIKDSKCYFTGLNLHYFLLAEENGELKIVTHTVPSFNVMSELFGDSELAKTFVVDRTNFSAPSRTDIVTRAATYEPVYGGNTPPLSILFRKADNTIVNLTLREFTYAALQAEWGGLVAQPQARKAGAIACKTKGWYRTVNPISGDYDISRGQIGYDPNYDSTIISQVESTWYTIMTNSNGYIFDAYFTKGIPGQYDSPSSDDYQNAGYHTGCVSQYGSGKMADGGSTYATILHYYYDNSLMWNISPNGPIVLYET